MHTNNTKKSHRTPIYRRPAVILTFVALLVVVAVIVFLIICNLQKDNTTDSAPQPENQTTVEQDTDDSSLPHNYNDAPASDDDTWESKVKQYEGENANTMEGLTGYVSYQDVDEARNVSLYTVIDQNISQGTCTLNLKQGDHVVYTTSVAAHVDATTSICDPFNFSAAQLSPGAYQIEIQLSGDNKTGIIKSEVNL